MRVKASIVCKSIYNLKQTNKQCVSSRFFYSSWFQHFPRENLCLLFRILLLCVCFVHLDVNTKDFIVFQLKTNAKWMWVGELCEKKTHTHTHKQAHEELKEEITTNRDIARTNTHTPKIQSSEMIRYIIHTI